MQDNKRMALMACGCNSVKVIGLNREEKKNNCDGHQLKKKLFI